MSSVGDKPDSQVSLGRVAQPCQVGSLLATEPPDEGAVVQRGAVIELHIIRTKTCGRRWLEVPGNKLHTVSGINQQSLSHAWHGN